MAVEMGHIVRALTTLAEAPSSRLQAKRTGSSRFARCLSDVAVLKRPLIIVGRFSLADARDLRPLGSCPPVETGPTCHQA